MVSPWGARVRGLGPHLSRHSDPLGNSQFNDFAEIFRALYFRRLWHSSAPTVQATFHNYRSIVHLKIPGARYGVVRKLSEGNRHEPSSLDPEGGHLLIRLTI
jgi:hypothetical protein